MSFYRFVANVGAATAIYAVGYYMGKAVAKSEEPIASAVAFHHLQTESYRELHDQFEELLQESPTILESVQEEIGKMKELFKAYLDGIDPVAGSREQREAVVKELKKFTAQVNKLKKAAGK
jgi:predicted hydrocarbon binding protein